MAEGTRHLRVTLALGSRSLAVRSIWLVDGPAIVPATLANPILVRVDVAGGMTSVQTHADPRVSRGTMREGLGHSFATSDEGLLRVSVPFVATTELNDVRIRATDLTDVRVPERSADALARLFDEPLPAMRAVREVGTADLVASRDWAEVAGALGISAGAGRYEIYVDRAGRYRWRLRRSDGQIVADSGGGYAAREACEADLRWVQANAGTAPVVSLDVAP
jgi:uncharacterized protein